MAIVKLASIDIPIETGLKRDKPQSCIVKNEAFWDFYDSKTLFYDIVHDPRKKRLRAYAPRLWGIETDVRMARFYIDGKEITPDKFRKGRHIDIIEFNSIKNAHTLKIVILGAAIEQEVNRCDTAFDGTNGIFTKSKNNRLDWIQDWASYHVKEHGATSVIIADNGSSAYSLDELDHVLQNISGLQQVRVINADKPFGPSETECSKSSLATSLQVALLNIGIDRFFGSNSVMLNVDIDELVVSKKNRSIFDETRRKIFGHITFEGHWTYSKKPSEVALHSDHFWVKKEDNTCPTKYALASHSPFRKFQLQVHNIAHVDRNFFKSRRDFYFLHCKQISTSWKYDRAKAGDADYIIDAALQEKMRQVFPDT